MYQEWLNGVPLYCGIPEYDRMQDKIALQYYKEKGQSYMVKFYENRLKYYKY